MSFDLNALPSHLVAKGTKKGENLPPVVKVGEGATESIGSDRVAYTVIEVKKNGRQLVLQADNAEMTSGDWQSERQVYKFTPNPDGSLRTINWAPSKKRFGGAYQYFSIGHRTAYRDPHF